MNEEDAAELLFSMCCGAYVSDRDLPFKKFREVAAQADERYSMVCGATHAETPTENQLSCYQTTPIDATRCVTHGGKATNINRNS